MNKPFEVDIIPVLRRVHFDVTRQGGKIKHYRRIMARVKLGQALLRIACWLMFFEYNEFEETP